MRKPAIIFLFLLLISSALVILRSIEWNREVEEDDAGTAKLREEYFFNQRAFPFNTVPLDWRVKAIEHMHRNMTIEPLAVGQPVPIGPAPITGGRTFNTLQNLTGRITSLAVDPTDPTIVYLGSAQGGLWRSTNAGQNWQPMADNAPTLAIGAIAVDPTNRNTIYVGTGEGNDSLDSFFGMGVLKTTDGGQSWANLAAQTFAGLSFSKLFIDPRNSNTLYGAVVFGFAGLSSSFGPQPGRSGIYRSTNGGQSWNIIFSVTGNGFIFDTFDVEMDPNDSSILYASVFGQGIFKSTNGGQNWNRLAGGLPTSGFGRSSIALSRSNPNVLYTSFQDSRTIDLLNIFKSVDGGNSWNIVTQPPRTRFGNICQCFYDNLLEIDPTNPDIVYFGGVSFFKSINGGQSWVDVGKGSIGTHEDYHAMAFTPGNPNQFYIGNDGGVWFSADGGNTLVNRNTDLSLTQFQSIAMHPTDPNILIGGTQDNGTNMYLGANTWQQVDIADGGFSAIDQVTPNVMYHTYQNVPGRLFGPARSRQGGRPGTWLLARNGININDPVLFYAPFILDPNNQSTLYFGTFRLYRSTDQGDNWTPISDKLAGDFQGAVISTISVAPGAPQIIYTGSNDGSVFTSGSGGDSFRNVTGNLPQRFISDIVFEPGNRSVYASLSGFRSGHVFKSIVGSTIWADISGNLPDVPVNTMLINPSDPANIFVGTDMGLFETRNGGTSWSLMQGLPRVAVFDLAYSQSLGVMRIATHGRGIYEINLIEPDYALMATPATQGIPAGNLTSFQINAQRIGNFTQPINLNAAVSPSNGNITAVLSSNSVTPGSSATLTINSLAGTPPSLFTITITGTAGQIVRTATVTVNITGVDDFKLIATPASQIVTAGAATSFTIGAQSIGAFNQPINLSATVDSAGSNIQTSFSPATITPGSNSTLTVNTLAGTPTSILTLTITGTGGSLVRTATVTLNIVTPDFELLFNPAQVNLSRGQAGKFTVNINRTGGFAGNVTVTAPDTKALKLKLSPASQSTTGTSVQFDFKLKKKAPTGSKQIVFSGRDDSGRVRTGTLTLIIQ